VSELEMDLPENPVVTRLEAIKILDVNSSALTNWKNRKSATAYCLQARPDGKYDLRDIATFLLKRSIQGRQNKTLKPKARCILEFYGMDPKAGTSRPTVRETPDIPTDQGIEHALKRVQAMEVSLSKKVTESLADPSELHSAINNWNKILEILRKTEVDCLKVLEEKNTLVRIDDAMEIYNKGILPVKTKMRQLPSAIAADLVDQDRATIEEILEEQIDKALEGIADVWK